MAYHGNSLQNPIVNQSLGHVFKSITHFIHFRLDFDLVFGVDTLKMNKAERLMYCESLMTHAMMFTAVNLVVRYSFNFLCVIC